MGLVSEADILRYVSSILTEFVRPGSPLHYINIGDVEQRLRDGVFPLDVTETGYSDTNYTQNSLVNTHPEQKDDSVLSEAHRTTTAFRKIYGLSPISWAA